MLPGCGRASQLFLQADAVPLGEALRASVLFAHALVVPALVGACLPHRFPLTLVTATWACGPTWDPARRQISRRAAPGLRLRALLAVSDVGVAGLERHFSPISRRRRSPFFPLGCAGNCHGAVLDCRLVALSFGGIGRRRLHVISVGRLAAGSGIPLHFLRPVAVVCPALAQVAEP